MNLLCYPEEFQYVNIFFKNLNTVGGLFIFVMGILEDLNLNSFYGRHAVYEVYTLLLFMVGINESRYILQRLPLPKLTWYYDSFSSHEMKQTYLNWFDSIEEISRKFLGKTKDQIDYYLIHKEYNFIKKRLLSSYLENERIVLSKHFNERSLTLLQTIKSFENNNLKSEIIKIAEEALNIVLNTVKEKEKNKEILKTSFESALIGLKNGKMEYSNDKIIPLFLSNLQIKTKNLISLTNEEENKLFSLSQKQKEILIELDRRNKLFYLEKSPEISTNIKNSEIYKNILNRIKSRVSKI